MKMKNTIYHKLAGALSTIKLSSSASLVIAVFVLSACNGATGIFNGLDTAIQLSATPPPTPTPLPPGAVACGITNMTPTNSSTIKVSGVAGTLNTFVAGLTDASCTAVFKLNGTTIANVGGSVSIDSANLNFGNNTLSTTSGGVTSTWTIFKNTPPTCSSQTPASAGNSSSPGLGSVYTGNASDGDNDALTFTWKVNGSTVSNAILSSFTAPTSSQATFTPTAAFLGANTLSMNISDGTDQTACTWNVTVNPQCTISATTPVTGSPIRVPFLASSTTNFQGTASAGCNFQWSLNGSPIPGATNANYTVTSSTLGIGANTLQLTVSNGGSSDSKTWSVVKNTPPTCASQTPASTGSTIPVGGTLNLTANGADLDGDPLSFTWKDNGNAVGTPIYTITSTPGTGSGNSVAAFVPDSTYVGNQTVTAYITDGYDTTSCAWTVHVAPVCAITSSSPSGSTLRVSNVGTTNQLFAATANDPSCTVSWTVDGNTIGSATTAFLNVLSSSLVAGPATNTVAATYSNGTTTATRTWTVTKNQPPTCSTQTPAAAGSTVGVGGNLTYNATAGNVDADTLSYTWQWNGTNVNPTYFTTTSSGNTASSTFSPNASYVGSGTASVVISDGYDSATCSWGTTVVNSCSINSSFPSTATYKMAHLGTTSNSFGVIPNDATCLPTWKLNGTTVNTTQYFLPITSSQLNDGPASNTLSLTLDNGVSTPTTRTWTVTKNQVPLCFSQNPAAAPTPTPLPYTATKTFTATASDPDSDALSSMTWLYNGVSTPALFNSITTVGNTSTATFAPTFSQIGSAQKVSFSFTDTYDTTECPWNFDITNPNTVHILSCTPSTNPIVVYSSGVNSSQTLQVVASNASGFKWYLGGSQIGGAASASLIVTTGSGSPGLYAYRGLASDAQGNSVYCDYSVKLNAPPVINTATPSTAQTWKLNYGSTMTFNVAATDANSDALTYTWTLDGSFNAALPSGGASSILNPNFNTALVGAHVVQVTVSDGYETASQSWNIEINYFSSYCNTLFNGSVASVGGKICTLVGVPGVGDNLNPTADQTLTRISPMKIIDDGSGNWFIADNLSSSVIFYNRSAAPITLLGKTVAAGTISFIAGDGSNGYSQDNVYNNNFKFNGPWGLAYDSAAKILYISDYYNNRIAQIDNTGFATTVMNLSVSNNTAGNTDGSLGTAHYCQNPSDVHLVNYGGRRWLYVACSGSNAIKRIDVDPASGTYLKAYTVIGRLGGGSTSWGLEDGATGPAGDARANVPWAIDDDGNGNIYWTDQNSYRVRMATTSGNAVTFFGGTTQTTGTMTLTATDTSGALTAATANISAVAVGGAASALVLMGPASVVTSGCSAFKVYLVDSGGTPTVASGAKTVTLTGMGAGNVYSDSGCTAALAGGNLTIANATSEGMFYYENTAAATVTLNAASGGLTASTLGVTTAAAGTATQLAVKLAPSSYVSTLCTKYLIQAQNAGGSASSLGSAKTIRMNHNGVGNFYSTSTCTGTPTVTFTLSAGTTEVPVYFATTVVAPANQAVTLMGNMNSNVANLSSTSTSIGAAVTLRIPRGIAVRTSAGSVQGIFVSNYDYCRNYFVNNTSSAVTYGGATVNGYSAAVVAGTGSCGFNSDGIGNVTYTNYGWGLSISADKNSLLIGDYNQFRARSLDLSIASGQLNTYVGAGFARWGNLGDSPIPVTGAYLNSPRELVLDNTNRLMYVSDTGNSRIRVINLLTGLFNTAVGKGWGTAAVEGVAPTAAYLQSPAGLALMSSGGTNFLIYADTYNNSSTGINANCQVRAVNLTPSFPAGAATTLFSTSINRGTVSTIAGDYTQGCQSWTASPAYGASTTAIGSKINNPEGIMTDGTNLFMTMLQDHCILKLTPAGVLSPVIGTCGTAGLLDGSTTVATVRYPTGIVMDPLYAADGNFFFADAVDQGSGKVRYVNYRTSAVQIGSTTVPAATAPNGIVQTVYTETPTPGSQGQIYGLAVFGSEICYASGKPGDGSIGGHNVYCYDRTNSLGAFNLRVGPSETANPPLRGGAPLDNTVQEGVNAQNAFLSAPIGLGFDTAGNLYISDRNNSLIRFVKRWW